MMSTSSKSLRDNQSEIVIENVDKPEKIHDEQVIPTSVSIKENEDLQEIESKKDLNESEQRQDQGQWTTQQTFMNQQKTLPTQPEEEERTVLTDHRSFMSQFTVQDMPKQFHDYYMNHKQKVIEGGDQVFEKESFGVPPANDTSQSEKP